MSNSCIVCYLVRIQSHGDRPIDERIKADARCHLSQVEGSDLTVDEFIGNESPANKTKPNEEKTQYARTHQSFLDYCRTLFRNHQDSRVQCGICGNKVRMRDRNTTLNCRYSFNHACLHLGKKIFACAHCDNTYMSLNSVIVHLNKEHNLNSNPSNYIDSSSSHEQEILEILKQCYGSRGSKTGATCLRPQFGRIHQPFRAYCKQLFRDHRDSRVQCGICGNKVAVRDQRQQLKYTSSFSHACLHLGKMIFACAHCDNTYTCMDSVLGHLKEKHKLKSHPSNYIDSSASYEQEILETLKRCYDNTGSETVISGAIKKKQNFRYLKSYPLSNFCRKLVKSIKDWRAHCSICDRVLVFRKSVQSLIDHAYIHLGKPLFKCGQCDLQFFARGAIRHHLIKAHVLSICKENYIDISSNYEKEMMDMLERCFGQQNLVKSEPSDQPKRRPRSLVQYFNDPLSNECRKLFANLPLDARVRCSLCDFEKKLLYLRRSNPTIETSQFITHTLAHLAKPMFKCRLCDYSARTRPTMAHHLISFHKTSGSRVNFVDDTAKHRKEIIAILEKCFNQANAELQVSGAPQQKKEPIAAIRIRGQAGTDTLLAERSIRSYELTRKFQKSGKIRCRICLLEIVSEKAMQHVITHLNSVIYHCRLCTHGSITKAAIQGHVKLVHGQSSINQYEDRSNDFHAELLKLLSDCFDWDQESARGQAKEEHAVRLISRILGRCRGSDKTAARVLHCYQLGQKFSQEGRISCRICSASIAVTNEKGQIRSQMLLNHAVRHIKKVHRFKCSHCSETAHTRNTMTIHLKTVHDSTDKSDCEDRADMYHSKIMKALTRCFDWCQK